MRTYCIFITGRFTKPAALTQVYGRPLTVRYQLRAWYRFHYNVGFPSLRLHAAFERGMPDIPTECYLILV